MGTPMHALQTVAASEPAGGAATGQVVIATLAASVAFSILAWLCVGHRSGRVPYLYRAARLSERLSGLPGWAALPSAISAVSLLVALLGMYWDISLHIDVGRDAGPLANPAHYLILAGLFGILAAGTVAVFLPDERPGPRAVHIAGDWYAPVGGLLIAACAAFALLGFPLDDGWHRIFGQDVTLWGPTHLMLIGGATMTLIGQAVLLAEGTRFRRRRGGSDEAPLAVRVRRTALVGGLLIGLSTFQAEFDFGVPQFRFVLEPALLAIAASLALVCARIWIGRGGALVAAGFFIAVRGAIALAVGGVLGEATPHLPLYLAEALCVEVAALVVMRASGGAATGTAGFARKPRHPSPFALAAVSGVLIGTVGFAAEYGWSQIAMPLPWTTDLLPAGPIMATVGGFAGAGLGALLALALRGELPAPSPARSGVLPPNALRAAPALALVAIMAVLGYGLVTSVPSDVSATVRLSELSPRPDREVAATVRIDPSSAASDPAWLNVTAWQGGGLVIDRLDETGPGTYRTTEPIPVHGDWKAMVRLQTGNEILAVPIYLPKDTAIPAPKVRAPQTFTRPFVSDHQILQREQKPGVPGWLTTVAPLIVLAISLSLLALLAWGVGRIGRRQATVPSRSERAAPPLTPIGARS
jgi:hypothetical protein